LPEPPELVALVVAVLAQVEQQMVLLELQILVAVAVEQDRGMPAQVALALLS
jgi:hypothetical protein